MKILITGGAGYVGTTLVPLLLKEGHDIVVYDDLLFGGDQLLTFFEYPNFSFVKGDIRDINSLQKHVESKDVIIHLAAIVGYPACRKNPDLARSVNIDGTKNLINSIKDDQLVIYASTGSNYGSVDDVCTEDTPLKPLSLYGQTKTMAEHLLLQRGNTIAFRFATAFGISPRLRLDLLVNDFTYKCISQGYMVVYEKDFRRTFIHVRDMARAFNMAIINNKAMIGEVYNVGDDSLNYTKKEICDIISEKTGAYIHYATVGEDADKRDYLVSYEKIKKLGYHSTVTIENGVNDLIQALKVIDMKNHYCNA